MVTVGRDEKSGMAMSKSMSWRGARMPRPRAAALGRAGRVAACLAIAVLVNITGLLLPAQPRALAASNPIQVENTYPGDPTWNDFSADLNQNTLSGYASQTSVNKGQSIDFYVTATAPNLSITIYRTGWYSGVGARKMLSMGSFTGVAQPACPINSKTGMISCSNWSKTATLSVPTSWTTGVYLAKLISSTGFKSFIYFVVRNDGGTEDVVFQSSVTTAEAYNMYGGISLYDNQTDKSVFNGPHAVKVSFDRPFLPGDGNGAGQYLSYEYPFVRWAESQGFSLTYITNIDTATGVNPLTSHKAFLSVGHDEYWSKSMRDNVQAAINTGVNVAFFSGNTCYWQIRLESNAAGAANRIEVGYKDFATDTTFPGPDPQWNVNNAIVTTNWRSAPVNQPENALLGVMYEDSDTPSTSPYIVQNASNWIYAGTGFTNGTSIPGIVGYEYDRTWNNGAQPAGLTVLSNSPVTGIEVGASHANSSIYTAASGAKVFAAGTIQWSWGLDNFPNHTYANAGIQKTTANILYNFTNTSPLPPPPPLPAGTYIVDGFESGNLTQWTGPNGNSQASVEYTDVNSGAYAASLNNTATGQYVYLYQDLSVGPEALTYSRFYFKPATLTSSATLAQGRDANNNTMWSVSFDQPRSGLDIYFWNGARTRYDLYTLTNVVNPNGWNAVEVELNEATAGHGEVWANGTSVAKVDADLSSATPYSRMFLYNDGVGSNYFDDVKVSNAYNGLLPVSLSPASLTYDTQQVGTTSAAKTETLTNTGASPLDISSVTITGANAGDFAISGDTCSGASVLADNNCTVGVTFKPTAGGNRAASLSFADNAGNSPQSIALSGSGGAPGVTLSPTSVSFGTQNVGTTSAARAVTLTNSGTWPLTITSIAIAGTNAGDFAQTNTCPTGSSTLAAGTSCTISVTFTPSATGSRGASLTVTDDAGGSPHSVALAGASLPPGTYLSDGFESGNLVLWNTPSGPGQAQAQTSFVYSGTYAAALTNASGQYVGISDTLAGGGQATTYTRFYVQVGSGVGTSTIAIGKDANGSNRFVITYDQNRQGLDVYVWNGAGTRYDLYTNMNLLAPNTWYAVELFVDEQTSGTATVYLNGNQVATTTGDLSAATPYSQLTLFNESTGNIYFDEVKVSNAYNGLIGAPPPAPAASLSTNNLTFSSQQINTSSGAQSVTLSNSGTANMTVSGVTLTGTNAGDFSISANACNGVTLTPGSTCSVSVVFTPTASGSRTAALSFADNAAGNPQQVVLSGTGATAPPPPPAPGTFLDDGFEAGNLNAWSPGGTGTATDQTTVVNSGTYAAALTNTSGQYETLHSDLAGGPQALTYTRFYFQYTTGLATTTIATGTDSNGNNMWACDFDAVRQGLDCYFWNGARARYDLYTNTNVLAPNTWYAIEVQFDESSSGSATLYINGTNVASVTGDLSLGTSSGYGRLYLWNETTGTIYYDDVKVTNSFI